MNYGILLVPFIAIGLLFSAVWTSIAWNNNAVYAQQQQIPISKQHNIRIISPATGQQVPVNGNLTIRGIVNYGLATRSNGTPTTSTTAVTSGCFVSVAVNGVLPYHRALATGSGGSHDYSKWKYVVDPKSTPIKQGPNKIAAKLACPQAPNLDSRYVITLTGAGSAGTTSTTNATQAPAASTSSPPPSGSQPTGIPGLP